MNEMIKLIDDSYDRYEELLIRKDVLRKEAVQYEYEYVKEFGDLISDAFKAKISCIEKKKIIAYCQAIINKGGTINAAEMEEYISTTMADYNEQLREMLERNKAAKGSKPISQYEFRQIKKIYYAIAKLIHPDMSPGLKDDETIADLWNRTVIAYQCNHLNELEQLQVMVNHYLESIDYKHDDIVIDNIEEKIFELNEEIDRIINTDPYMYKYLLSDPDEVKEKKEDLKKEISDFLNYADELDKVIAGFHIERNFS